jgi:hypothetical protein
MELTQCPDPTCDAPAEVLDRIVQSSTDGGIEHIKVRCLHRHWFLMPVSSLKSRTPSGHPAARSRAW